MLKAVIKEVRIKNKNISKKRKMDETKAFDKIRKHQSKKYIKNEENEGSQAKVAKRSKHQNEKSIKKET
jgi:aspartyl-tRNA synthetase